MPHRRQCRRAGRDRRPRHSPTRSTCSCCSCRPGASPNRAKYSVEPTMSANASAAWRWMRRVSSSCSSLRAKVLHARPPYRAVGALTTRYTGCGRRGRCRSKGEVMGLRLKFNLVLLVMFSLGLGVSAYVSYELLQRNARDEVQRSAGLMMEAALSMRVYTVGQVRPHLRVVEDEFLPQAAPALGAP